MMDPNSRNYRETYAFLCNLRPPLPGADAETQAQHDRRAMEAVAALHPYDAFEAETAALIVGMQMHAADCLRAAGLAINDPAEMRRCRNQATSMARQADSSLRTLQRRQAERDKHLAERHPAAMERAGYWFHEITVPEPAAPEPQPEPQPDPVMPPYQQMTEAEKYAVHYPCRAAEIRAIGGLPPNTPWGGALTPATVEDIAHGTSPVFLALDREFATMSRQAA